MKTRKYFLVALLLTLGLGQNVGIGTNAPTQRLHVAGNLRLDGVFMPNDQPGNPGNILLSQGANTPPVWLANGATGTILTMGSSGPTWAPIPNPICTSPSPTQNRFTRFISTSPPAVCNTTLAENDDGNIWNDDGSGSPVFAQDKFEIIATGSFPYAINGYATTGIGVYGEATGDNGRGVNGAATGANGIGVRGAATGNNGIGVLGAATGANGTGVWGITDQATGIGVRGVNTNANGTAGVFVNTAASGGGTGYGVIGITQQSGANGVYAYTANAASIGALWAVNDAPAGTGTGLGAGILSRQRGGSALVANLRNDGSLSFTYFINTVITAYHMGGVSGANAPAGIVAQVASNDNNARAIVGQHNDGPTTANAFAVTGIMARGANSTGLAIAVLGNNTRTGLGDWAVFANGNMGASGVKPFMIDHPLDPENKYLLHYAAEGPEPYNLYRGVVTTDASGRAVVHLPDYFEAANKDFSYYLQPIGTFAQVIVEEEVRNNEFVIRTDKPNVKVSWMVLATRNDPYVRYFWKPTVIEKSPEQRGKYLIPQVYGKDDSYGIFPGPVPSVNSPEHSIPALPKNPEIKTPKSEK